MQQNSENLQPAPVPQNFPLPVGQVPTAYNRTQPIVYSQYQCKYVHRMSITLIILGVVCFVVQIGNFFIHTSSEAAGIWGGIWIIVTGSFGVVSCKKRTLCTIMTFMVLCITGSVIAAFPFGHGAAGMALDFHDGEEIASFMLSGIMLLAALISCILMIVSATYTCKAVCPDCNQGHPNLLSPGQAHYMMGPNGETQVVIMPVNQPMAASQFPSSTSNPGYIHPGPPTGSAPPGIGHPPPYQEHARPPQYEKKKSIDK